MSSGDVSRNIGLGRVEFSRHVWRPLNSSNYELRRRVEKYWTWSGRIFSARLETPLFRRIMSSGDVSRNIGLGRVEFSRARLETP
jgi:hypothetical protein